MTQDTFVKDAIRTESRIEQVTINPIVFNHIKSILIEVGSMLDQIKKHTFYRKPYHTLDLHNNLIEATYRIEQLNKEFKHNWPLPQGERTAKVNPRIFHAVVGSVTEAVELLQAIDLDTADYDKVNLLEEFGDLNWYEAIGIDEAGGKFDAVLDKVIAKLRARYPEKFTNENAINRDLGKERAILEGKSNG